MSERPILILNLWSDALLRPQLQGISVSAFLLQNLGRFTARASTKLESLPEYFLFRNAVTFFPPGAVHC